MPNKEEAKKTHDMCEVCGEDTEHQITAGCSHQCFLCEDCIKGEPTVVEDKCAACTEDDLDNFDAGEEEIELDNPPSDEEDE